MYADVVIVGAGPVGGLLSLALARQGISVIIIDQKDIESIPQDHRQFALSLDVLTWIDSLGIRLEKSPVTEVCLSFQGHKEPLVFTAQEAGSDKIGAIVPYSSLVYDIRSRIKTYPNIRVLSPCQIAQWEWKEAFWQLSLSTGKKLSTSLVVGCDGADSRVRHFFAPSMYKFSFPQRICLFTFSPFAPCVAYEHFFPGGSLALLPLKNGHGAGIWMGSEKDFQKLSLESCVENYLDERGFPHSTITLSSKNNKFVPHLQIMRRCVFPRCVLVGDAAQVVHPIAGQGVNLGLRMARLLSEHISHRKGLGLDLGLSLESYHRQWRKASLALQGATTAIVAGYSLISWSSLWGFTLGCMHAIPSLRQKLASHATWGPSITHSDS
jgi:2-octaprenyl-3-methyl-6-methoxy-1,4-benzoquinol hydroxylase/2-octaprenylphenol hydroxylase